MESGSLAGVAGNGESKPDVLQGRHSGHGISDAGFELILMRIHGFVDLAGG